MITKLIYQGGGFIPGVPARDLTEKEVNDCGGVQLLTANGLYKETKAKPVVKTGKGSK